MDYNQFLENKEEYDCDIRGMVSYLISLFYRTNCKYECSRRKINRLLTIYKLCCNKNGYDCFETKFHIASPYSFVLGIEYVERDIYIRHSYNDYDENNMPKESILKKDDEGQIEKMPYPYNEHLKSNQISNSAKKVIDDIFETFGGFEFGKLADMIDDIMDSVPAIKSFDKNNYIFTNRVKGFFENESNNEKYENNLVFQFIKNYHIDKDLNFQEKKRFNYFKVSNYIFKSFKNLSFEKQKKLLNYLEQLLNNNDTLENGNIISDTDKEVKKRCKRKNKNNIK